jgi:hypothetical protein
MDAVAKRKIPSPCRDSKPRSSRSLPCTIPLSYGVEVHSSTISYPRLSSPERAPGTHWTEGWVGPRGGLDVAATRKTPFVAGNQTPAIEPVAYSLQWLRYPGTYRNKHNEHGHNSKEQNPSSEANSSTPSQEISRPLRNPKAIRARHWSLFWVSWIHSTSYYPFSLRSISITIVPFTTMSSKCFLLFKFSKPKSAITMVKAKVKLSLCLIKHHAVKMYWGVEGHLHTFLASALDGGEWSASRPGRLTPRERAPGTHWIGDWVSPRAVLDMVMKRKIPSPRRESNPRTPIVLFVAQRCTIKCININQVRRLKLLLLEKRLTFVHTLRYSHSRMRFGVVYRIAVGKCFQYGQ